MQPPQPPQPVAASATSRLSRRASSLPIASCTAEASSAATALGDAIRSHCVGVAETLAGVDLNSEAARIPRKLLHSREGRCLRSGEVSRDRGRFPGFTLSCSAVRDSTRAIAYSRHSKSRSRRASRAVVCCSHHASLASGAAGVVGVCIWPTAPARSVRRTLLSGTTIVAGRTTRVVVAGRVSLVAPQSTECLGSLLPRWSEIQPTPSATWRGHPTTVWRLLLTDSEASRPARSGVTSFEDDSGPSKLLLRRVAARNHTQRAEEPGATLGPMVACMQGSVAASPPGRHPSASPKPTISKRGAAASSSSMDVSSSHMRSGRSVFPAPERNSLVGRTISVPYSLIIEDDYSGCTCEAVVLERSARGYLVTLAGEQCWKPETFIRRWLSSSQPAKAKPPAEADGTLNHLFSATCDLGSSRIPTVPPTGSQADEMSRVPTSLMPLYGHIASLPRATSGQTVQPEAGGAAADREMQDAHADET